MNPAEVASELRGFLGKLPRRVYSIVNEETRAMTARIKQDRFEPYQPVETSPGHVYNRSGALKAALQSVTSQLQDEVKARLFVNPASPLQNIKASVSEHGTTIRAKPGGALAIPIHEQLNANGTRVFATLPASKGTYDLWLRGNNLIGRKKGFKGATLGGINDGGQFHLEREVTVPPKKWAEPEVEEAFLQMRLRIEDLFARFSASGEGAV